MIAPTAASADTTASVTVTGVYQDGSASLTLRCTSAGLGMPDELLLVPTELRIVFVNPLATAPAAVQHAEMPASTHVAMREPWRPLLLKWARITMAMAN